MSGETHERPRSHGESVYYGIGWLDFAAAESVGANNVPDEE